MNQELNRGFRVGMTPSEREYLAEIAGVIAGSQDGGSEYTIELIEDKFSSIGPNSMRVIRTWVKENGREPEGKDVVFWLKLRSANEEDKNATGVVKKTIQAGLNDDNLVFKVNVKV
jgi:hypothetical protein